MLKITKPLVFGSLWIPSSKNGMPQEFFHTTHSLLTTGVGPTYPLVNQHSWLEYPHFWIGNTSAQSGSILQPAMLDYRGVSTGITAQKPHPHLQVHQLPLTLGKSFPQLIFRMGRKHRTGQGEFPQPAVATSPHSSWKKCRSLIGRSWSHILEEVVLYGQKRSLI